MRVSLARFLTIVAIAAASCSSGAPDRPTTPAPAPAAVTVSPSSTGALTEDQFKALHQLAETDQHGKGEWIEIGGAKAYLSLPPGAKGPLPAIVVIHEWWGLNRNIELWTDRIAGLGWAALAIDLYGGKVAKTPDEAMAAMKSVDDAAGMKIIDAAFDFLSHDPRIVARKKAVIGWCFGGGWSLQASLAHPELDGTIIYYGMLDPDPTHLAKIHGKLLGIFGNKDEHITPASVDAFEKGLTAAGVSAVIYRYEAPHAFANPSNPAYDQKAAANAWSHVEEFLRDVAAN